MKSKKLAAALLCTLLCTAVLSACSPEKAAESSPAPQSSVSSSDESSEAPSDGEASEISAETNDNKTSSDAEGSAESAEPSEDQSSAAETSKTDETSKSNSENSSLPINAHQVTSDDQEALGTKTLESVKETFENRNENPDSSTSLFKKYFADKIKQDNSAYTLTLYGNENTISETEPSLMTAIITQQTSGDNMYYKLYMALDCEENSSILLKKGNRSYLISDEDKIVIESEPDDDVPDSDSIIDVTEEIKNLTESGTCRYEGKDMQYELYKDGSTYTILYFYDNAFYKAEIYQSTTNYSTSITTGESVNPLTDSDLKLVGYMYAQFDMPVNQDLFEIPSDYQTMTMEEYYNYMFSKYYSDTENSSAISEPVDTTTDAE